MCIYVLMMCDCALMLCICALMMWYVVWTPKTRSLILTWTSPVIQPVAFNISWYGESFHSALSILSCWLLWDPVTNSLWLPLNYRDSFREYFSAITILSQLVQIWLEKLYKFFEVWCCSNSQEKALGFLLPFFQFCEFSFRIVAGSSLILRSSSFLSPYSSLLAAFWFSNVYKP